MRGWVAFRGEQETLDCTVGWFGDEAGDLPLYFTSGGQAVCV